MTSYTPKASFIDLATQQNQIKENLNSAISNVLSHGKYIMGPEVALLENELKNFTGADHVITCGNGTDALTIVLMAWNIKKGDAVFVPAFSYIASAEAPAQLGATPFFVDVNAHDFNMNSESLKQAIIDAKKLGLKPAVIMPVDLFGQQADINSISAIAKENNIKVLIDGAQSFGSSSNSGKMGTLGDATTTSFFPAKPLGCYGDGGAIFTSDNEIAEKIRSIRLHGKGNDKYDHERVGVNSRLDTIQAAILIEKLKIFPKEIELRNQIAKKYNNLNNNIVITPKINNGNISVWAQYTLRSKERTAVREIFSKSNIPTVIYYPKPLFQQQGYGNFPVVSSGAAISEQLCEEVFSVPMHPYITDELIDKIISLIREY